MDSELTRKVADAIRWASEHGGWDDMARAAFAVFSEHPLLATVDMGASVTLEVDAAQKPTDDEREALAQVLHASVVDAVNRLQLTMEVHSRGIDLERELADAVLAAGFRRPVSPEPSEAKCEHGTSLTELCEHVERLVNAEPQTEPTDAQLLAALNAKNRAESKLYESAPDLEFFTAGSIYVMRAALRAAAETTNENGSER